MSYICEFCGLRPECCACSVDLTEPRLVTELAVEDNIMAAENTANPRPYGLLDAPSPSAFFSLLVELEEQENQLDLGPLPQLIRHNNIPEQDEQLICDEPMPTTPTKLVHLDPPIPVLERQNNIHPQVEDLDDIAVELFPEQNDEIPIIEYCEACWNFICDCDKMVFCDCGALYHIDEPYGMCFQCEMDMRKQDLIDQQRYPDDIPERYNSYDSF